MGVVVRGLAIFCALGFAPLAHAEAPHGHKAAHATPALKGGPIGQTNVRYDQAAQKYETTVAVAADLRAPNAQIARVRAESHAGVVAVDRMMLALKETKQKATRELVEGAIKKPAVTDTQYGSDGSVTMTFSLATAELVAPRPAPPADAPATSAIDDAKVAP